MVQGGIPDGVLFGEQVCQELSRREESDANQEWRLADLTFSFLESLSLDCSLEQSLDFVLYTPIFKKNFLSNNLNMMM